MAKRILIIDDDPMISDFLREIAIDIGYEVSVSNDAEQFKRALAEEGADVILLDLMLPNIDGIELLGHLAQAGVRAPILIVSGTNADLQRMAYQIGVARGLDMAGVLQKPLQTTEVREFLIRLRDSESWT